MGGQPCIRRLRVTVASVLRMVASGMSVEELLVEHPDLEREDVAECLRFAALLAEERLLPAKTFGA
ncbi:MAG: DUF433 domain-containing protein [Phycisphaerales bacterium]|nr:DUF433 domain-containing protein [Phycisphaerales bacterium]